MPKVALHTLGCKLNFAETATLGKQFTDRGFDLVDFGDPADVCVINTCSVTERADRECRQLIRRALRSSGRSFVIVTGCYAQLAPEAVASIAGVDLVLGSKEKFSLFDHAGEFRKPPAPRIAVSDVRAIDDFGPAWSTHALGRTRAYLKIQDGCDYNCSFCTIPRARGGSRSQPIRAAMQQAGELVAEGFKEIILTGVNVGDYGRHDGTSLLALVQELVMLPGLERLRISSIEPNLLTPALLDLMAKSPVMCKHVHIPLQSGCDEVLRAMRRRYTSAQYGDLVRRVADRIPGCGIGADVIVGFPGETEEHFMATYMLLADLPITYLHVFTYSERPDTPAAAMGDAVSPALRSRRNEMLRILGMKKKRAFYEQAVGSTASILTEADVQDGRRSGLTSNYVRVSIPAERAPENAVVPVRILAAGDDACEGEPAAGSVRA